MVGKTVHNPQTCLALTGPRSLCVWAFLSPETRKYPQKLKDNFEKRLLALEKCLNIWSSRDLTPCRKINIVKNVSL